MTDRLPLPARGAAFAALGGGQVVAGGFVAAADGAAPFTHGAWLAAYLVLVGGVAQLALGLGPLFFGTRAVSRSRATAQLVLWNAGNVLVMLGVLAGTTALVGAGSALLLGALGSFATGAGLRPAGLLRRRTFAYHGLVGVLVVSVLTGFVMASAAPAHAGTLLPERGGSPNADRIASLYAFVLVLALLVFVGVTVSLAFALVRYRARRNPVAAQIRGNTRLEIAWTAAAFGLIVLIAVVSMTRLHAIDHPDSAAASPATAKLLGLTQRSDDELHVQVVGRQYIWMFRYPNGAYSYEEMVAPVGVTVRLDITSLDVAHSWWIPKLGGKFDAIPGYVNHTWFRLERPGLYRGQCAELCGRGHADMLAAVRGVTPAAYAAWVARQKAEES